MIALARARPVVQQEQPSRAGGPRQKIGECYGQANAPQRGATSRTEEEDAERETEARAEPIPEGLHAGRRKREAMKTQRQRAP